MVVVLSTVSVTAVAFSSVTFNAPSMVELTTFIVETFNPPNVTCTSSVLSVTVFSIASVTLLVEFKSNVVVVVEDVVVVVFVLYMLTCATARQTMTSSAKLEVNKLHILMLQG